MYILDELNAKYLNQLVEQADELDVDYYELISERCTATEMLYKAEYIIGIIFKLFQEKLIEELDELGVSTETLKLVKKEVGELTLEDNRNSTLKSNEAFKRLEVTLWSEIGYDECEMQQIKNIFEKYNVQPN